MIYLVLLCLWWIKRILRRCSIILFLRFSEKNNLLLSTSFKNGSSIKKVSRNKVKGFQMSLFDRGQTYEIAFKENCQIWNFFEDVWFISVLKNWERGSAVIKNNIVLKFEEKNYKVRIVYTDILSPMKLMGKSKEIKQKWKKLRNFNICFSIILSAETKLIPRVTKLMPQISFESLAIFINKRRAKEYGNSSLILNHCKADTKSICCLTGSTNPYFSKSK